MEEKALVLHPERCTGCHACEMICSLVHDGECNLTLSRIGIMKTNGGGSNENIPIVCQQCHDPICADVCVMGAISYHHIKGCAMKCDLCSGDPECVKSCLYDAIEFLPMDEWGRKTRLKGAENLGRIFEILYK